MNAATSSAMMQLVDRVRAAAADHVPLRIRGQGTKDFFGGALVGDVLDITALSGVISYEPSELVITALAGTTLREIEAVLADRKQYLAFEPPQFDAGGTLGGMVAAGLSGPARASSGSVRDYVLGATMLNGRAEQLSFGGQVMKNVAGYDVSRVLAGSLGILGVITEVTLKVMPIAPVEVTLQFELDETTALRQINTWAGQPLPINASCWTDAGGGRLLLRLRGAQAAVNATCARLGGERVDEIDAAAWWHGCRDHSAPWFSQAKGDLWRISVPQTAPALTLTGAHLIEWHGGLRWYRLPPGHAAAARQAARTAGGHATLFRAATREGAADMFDSLSPSLLRIHQRLKHEFDPFNIFNRGRLYSEL